MVDGLLGSSYEGEDDAGGKRLVMMYDRYEIRSSGRRFPKMPALPEAACL